MNIKKDTSVLLVETEAKLVEMKELLEKIKFMEREINPIRNFLKKNTSTYIQITVKSTSKEHCYDFNCMPSRTILYPMLKKTIESYQYRKRLFEKKLEKLITPK